LDRSEQHQLRVAGIVLCGGHSRRMGQPKAWLPFGGELMLPRIVRILAEVVKPVVVVAASGQDVPPLAEGVSIVRDEHEDRGPLEGLVAGLHALQGKADATFLSACDVPLLRSAFVRRLIELIGQHDICVPAVNSRPYPLTGVYRVGIIDTVRQTLAKDQLKLRALLDILPTRRVSPDEFADVDPNLDSLRNINTSAEYEAELATYGRHVRWPG
jgi:molybdenum cofactor guanylyltransferase